MFSVIATLIHVPTNSMQGLTPLHGFSSNGFCWVLCCFTWEKGSLSVRPSFLSLPSARMASMSHHCLPLLFSHSHTLSLRWCLPVVWIIISHLVHAPNVLLSIFLYEIRGISPCFPALDLLRTDPLSQARHTWSPQTFPSRFIFPKLLFCNSNGRGGFSFTWTVCIIKYRKKWHCSNHSLISISIALGHPFPNVTVNCSQALCNRWVEDQTFCAEYKSEVDSPNCFLFCFRSFLFMYNLSAECVDGSDPDIS